MLDMAQKGKGASFQLNIRMTAEEMESLKESQKILGGLSQSDTIRLLIRMFLGKIPVLKKRSGFKSQGLGKSRV